MLRILAFVLFVAPGWLAAQEAPAAVEGALTVNVFQAKRLHDLGAVFIDVRPARQWSWGHVDGAVHLDLATEFAALASAEWPRALPLVIYCDSDVCPRSAEAARMAVGWGYYHVFYFRAGYFAWQLQDFPQGKGHVGEVPTLSAQAH